MTRSTNKFLLHCLLINVCVSLALTLFMWYTGKFLEGGLHEIAYILFLPSFEIISLFRGVNVAMHFTRYSTYLLVSFVFYSFVVGFFQVVLLKVIMKKGSLLTKWNK